MAPSYSNRRQHDKRRGLVEWVMMGRAGEVLVRHVFTVAVSMVICVAADPRPSLPAGAAPPTAASDLAVAVREFLLHLGSPNCDERWRAMSQEFPRLESRLDKGLLLVFEREVSSAPPPVRAKGDQLLAELRAQQEFEETTGAERWMRDTLWAALADPETTRQARFQTLKHRLLSIARDRSKDVIVRGTAIGTIGWVARHYEGDEDGVERSGVPVREWRRELLALVRDPDRDISALAAQVAAGLQKLAPTERDAVIGRLIGGLRHPNLGIRLGSQTNLERLTSLRFCVDPTDPPSEREPGIHKWEEWWAARSPS